MIEMTSLDGDPNGTRCRGARDHRASGCAPQAPNPRSRRRRISTDARRIARRHAGLGHINFGVSMRTTDVTTGAKWEVITAAPTQSAEARPCVRRTG